MNAQDDYIIKPDVDSDVTTRPVEARDQFGNVLPLNAVQERPLTLFLNSREIVTLMSVGDYPDLLGVGYLVNQNMLNKDDVITAIDYDEEIQTIVIRTEHETDYEDKLKRKVLTSGCAMGTIFGDIMDKVEEAHLSTSLKLRASTIAPVLQKIKDTPSLYQKAGSIHGCVLCQGDKPILYTEDVGRHNALDKIAGYLYLNNLQADDYYLYTTGRLTSEMVIKAVSMGITIVISRSGSTHWAIELAQKTGLTLINRARGKRFLVLNDQDRIIYDL